MQATAIVEIVGSLLALIILLGYQALHLWKVRRAPLSTSLGFNNYTRDQWVEFVIEEKRDVLAVQTLRNWTMAATFLASTAMLLALAFLNFGATTEKIADIANIANYYGSRSETLLMFKILANIAVFLFTFFNFTLAVRYYNHVAFMINVPMNRDRAVDKEKVTQMVNRGAKHYNLDMHGYYTSVPVFIWILGPIWFLISAVVVTAVMVHLDRVV